MLQFLLDEHISPTVCSIVRERRGQISIDSILEWRDGSLRGKNDHIVLTASAGAAYTLVTYDLRTILLCFRFGPRRESAITALFSSMSALAGPKTLRESPMQIFRTCPQAAPPTNGGRVPRPAPDSHVRPASNDAPYESTSPRFRTSLKNISPEISNIQAPSRKRFGAACYSTKWEGITPNRTRRPAEGAFSIFGQLNRKLAAKTKMNERTQARPGRKRTKGE